MNINFQFNIYEIYFVLKFSLYSTDQRFKSLLIKFPSHHIFVSFIDDDSIHIIMYLVHVKLDFWLIFNLAIPWPTLSIILNSIFILKYFVR